MSSRQHPALCGPERDCGHDARDLWSRNRPSHRSDEFDAPIGLRSQSVTQVPSRRQFPQPIKLTNNRTFRMATARKYASLIFNILITILGAGPFVAIAAFYIFCSVNPYSDGLHRDVMSGSRGGILTEVVAKYVPRDFVGAVKALRDLELVEGDKYLGVTYRRQELPERTEVNHWEVQRMIRYNDLLDENDAILLKRFSRIYVRQCFLKSNFVVFLFLTREGALKMHAELFPVFGSLL